MRTEISGVVYEVAPLLTPDGIPVVCRFVNLLTSGNSANTLTGVILGAMANRELANDVKYFCEVFAKHTEIVGAGTSVTLDTVFATHFRAKYRDLVEWLVFCFKVNVGEDFLAAIKAAGFAGTGFPSPSPEAPQASG